MTAIYQDPQALAELESKAVAEKAAGNPQYANLLTIQRWKDVLMQDYIDAYLRFDDEGTTIWSPFTFGKTRGRLAQERNAVEAMAMMALLDDYLGWDGENVQEKFDEYLASPTTEPVETLSQRLEKEKAAGFKSDMLTIEEWRETWLAQWKDLKIWFDDKMILHRGVVEGHLANGEPYPW